MANRNRSGHWLAGPPKTELFAFQRLRNFPVRFIASIASILAIVFFISKAQADPWACTPALSTFSAELSSLDQDSRKLSAREFAFLPISPSGVRELPAGTELNVVVDIQCLFDPRRGPQAMTWLKEIKNSAGSGYSSGGERSFHWKLDRNLGFEELQSLFEAEPCVKMVSPERNYYLNSMNFLSTLDPYSQNQLHLPSLGYQGAMRSLYLSLMIRKPVVIAIVDTGVDLQHVDLWSNRWINEGEIPGNDRDDDGNGYVDDVNGYNFADNISNSGPRGDWPNSSHGTHVAGLAAARMDNGKGGVGLNGLAKIMSLNVFLDSGHSRSSLLENAIRYAAEKKADIINMSVGGNEYSRTMRGALAYAVDRGSLIVAAAGNLSFEICDNPAAATFTTPAVYAGSINGMMAVGSIDAATGRFSLFSNYSSRLIQIAAPGSYHSQHKMGLLSTVPGHAYAYLQGTSMSAPIVSGAAALASAWLKAHGYESNGVRLEKILKESSRQDPSLSQYIQDGRILDLQSLAEYLKRNYPPRR